MCGLVFAGGRYSLSAPDLKLFTQMLMCDTFRGEHSTGVFSLFRPWNQDPFYKVEKSIDDGFDFVKSEEYYNVLHEKTKNSLGTEITEFPKVLFGHNRHATMGKVNARNAHPFTHGHITLAHNGTLDDQSLLPDHKNFEVDSENICYSISKIGIDETIKKLDGAFTLIWFDANEMTINLIRNSERPFHFVETELGDWFGASEEDMLMWLVNRGGKNKVRVKRHFEAEVGVQYVFDVSTGCVLKEERKHELPTFPKYEKWAAYEQYYNNFNRNKAQTTTPQTNLTTTPRKQPTEVLNELNQAEGTNFRFNERFLFEVFEVKPYLSNQLRGQLIGWIPNCTEYVEVQVHNVDVEKFKKDTLVSAQLVSAYIYKHCVHLVACNPENRGDDKPPFEIEEKDDTVVVIHKTKTGEIFSESNWRKSEHNTCANCSDPIPFDDVSDVEIINGYSFCPSCIAGAEEEAVAEAEAMVESRPVLSLKKEVSGQSHERFPVPSVV